jgi:hypothetical protein
MQMNNLVVAVQWLGKTRRRMVQQPKELFAVIGSDTRLFDDLVSYANIDTSLPYAVVEFIAKRVDLLPYEDYIVDLWGFVPNEVAFSVEYSHATVYRRTSLGARLFIDTMEYALNEASDKTLTQDMVSLLMNTLYYSGEHIGNILSGDGFYLDAPDYEEMVEDAVAEILQGAVMMYNEFFDAVEGTQKRFTRKWLEKLIATQSLIGYTISMNYGE